MTFSGVRTWLALAGVTLAAACTTTAGLLQGDGIDPRAVAGDARADYELFAQRCSKCHPLSRALNSGIDDDEFWKRYVERMRRQPASGISPEDTTPILRFLHRYSVEVKRARAAGQKSLLPLPGVSTPVAIPDTPPLPPPPDRDGG